MNKDMLRKWQEAAIANYKASKEEEKQIAWMQNALLSELVAILDRVDDRLLAIADRLDHIWADMPSDEE